MDERSSSRSRSANDSNFGSRLREGMSGGCCTLLGQEEGGREGRKGGGERAGREEERGQEEGGRDGRKRGGERAGREEEREQEGRRREGRKGGGEREGRK